MKNLKDIILEHFEYSNFSILGHVENPNFSIYERLHINKDIKPIFNEILDEYEECKFKDINIYKTNRVNNKPIEDKTLINEISKYFDDDDLVFLVTKKYGDPLNSEILKNLKYNKKPIMQKVYSVTCRVGFYIKKIPSINGICLIKKFFDKKNIIEKTQYIIKILN